MKMPASTLPTTSVLPIAPRSGLRAAGAAGAFAAGVEFGVGAGPLLKPVLLIRGHYNLHIYLLQGDCEGRPNCLWWPGFNQKGFTMNDSSKRLTRLSVIVGGVVAVIALIALLLTVMLSTSSAQDGNVSSGTTQQEAREETADAASCDYPKEWVGKDVDEAAVKKFAKSHRILGPNSAMTMDYRQDRINVETDDKGVVVRVFCG